jgi:hypothetical protein
MIVSILFSIILVFACDSQEPVTSDEGFEVVGENNNAIYFAKDCIVKIILNWPLSVRIQDRKYVIEKMVSSINNSLNKDIQRPSMAFPDKNYEIIYLQYTRNCSDKAEIALNLMQYIKEKINENVFPNYEVSHDIVEPGTNTILVKGPYWKD